MSAGHTPGPWLVCEHSWSRTGIYAGTFGIAALDIYDQATEETQDQCAAVMEANARLIAAAPELLEALTDALSYLEPRLAEFPTSRGAAMLPKLRAVMVKATGEQA